MVISKSTIDCFDKQHRGQFCRGRSFEKTYLTKHDELSRILIGTTNLMFEVRIQELDDTSQS